MAHADNTTINGDTAVQADSLNHDGTEDRRGSDAITARDGRNDVSIDTNSPDGELDLHFKLGFRPRGDTESQPS